VEQVLPLNFQYYESFLENVKNKHSYKERERLEYRTWLQRAKNICWTSRKKPSDCTLFGRRSHFGSEAAKA